MNTDRPEKKILSPQIAMRKAEEFCVYQERCQSEVRSRLYDWGLWQKDVESIIAELISSGFINEERFAKSYAGGKFRIKKWGRKKIILALKQKNISEYCIKIAINEIDPKEYAKTLQEIITKKIKETKEKTPLRLRAKLAAYAISRGFESELVWDLLNKKD
jgi:regulatory protein